MVLPIALVCSAAYLCRFGTGTASLLRGFLGSMGSPASHELRLTSRPSCRADLPALRPTRFHGDVRAPPGYPSPSPRRSNAQRWYRNIHLCIGYACRPRLSSTDPGRISLARNPHGLQRRVSRPSLLMPAFSLPCSPPTVARQLRPGMDSPTTDKTVRCFGTTLSPVYCRRMST